MQGRGLLTGLLFGLLFTAGCGAGKPAQAPDSEAAVSESTAGATDSKPTSGEAAGGEAGAKEPAKEEEAKEDLGPTEPRTPEDILKAPDVVFLFSFNDSEPKQAAEEACTKKAGDNPKKMNQCMAAARKKFPPDGHRFKKDDNGQWWWITVRQSGNRLTAIHKIPVEFGEQTDTTISLKPVGKDKGTSPINPPAKVVFEVPNDYQIALKDPKAGRLVFQAKVGVVAE